MSAIKALKDFLNDVGVVYNDGTARAYTFSKPIKAYDQEVVSIFYEEDNVLKMGSEENGFLFQSVVYECDAFYILKHIYDHDKGNADRLGYAMPTQSYEEFKVSDFIEGLENLRDEIDKIIAKANKRVVLDNDAWRIPAIALNMIMNDVQHYNRSLESLA